MTIRLIIIFLLISPCISYAQQGKIIRQYKVEEAKQAVAVDKDHFYVVNNGTITKHTKTDGTQVAKYDGKTEGLKHLNSGVIIKNRLYCANSNFPESPMAGAIEIFDASTMKHIGSRSFGIAHGSLTWVDQYEGNWYVGFAHYTKSGSSEGKDTRWTTIVKYNKDWVEGESWIFPANVVESFSPMSNSGAAWGANGLLYCTGHDDAEVFVMKLPRIGYTLEYIRTVPTGSFGQGISIDHFVKDKIVLYGINRKENTIVVSEIE